MGAVVVELSHGGVVGAVAGSEAGAAWVLLSAVPVAKVAAARCCVVPGINTTSHGQRCRV